jgi:glycosyltransferase involved in cell wall biosynthesis
MNSSSVSVVIAFHNGSKWIERALESVKAQNVKPAEIFVVDDGSGSSESTFLKSLESKYGFRTLHQENAGQSAARNLGVTESGSEFVCLLDQDDYFLPDHIDKLLGIAQIKDPKFAFSYGDLHRINESGKLLSESSINIEAKHPHKDIQTMLATNMHILPSATLIRRSAFIEVGGFDPQLRGYEDDDLFLRLKLAGYTNTFTPDAVSAWTKNFSSTSFSEAMSESRFIYLHKLLRQFPEGSLPGVSIFADLLHPRFGIHVADDVIGSALGVSGEHSKRVGRLKEYLSLVVKDKSLGLKRKMGFALLAVPLVALPKNVLRALLNLMLGSKLFSESRGPKTIRGFVKKYLPRKEALGG